MNDDNVVESQVVSQDEINVALEIHEAAAGYIAEIQKLDARIETLRNKRESLYRGMGKAIRDKFKNLQPQTGEPDDFEDTDPDGGHA